MAWQLKPKSEEGLRKENEDAEQENAQGEITFEENQAPFAKVEGEVKERRDKPTSEDEVEAKVEEEEEEEPEEEVCKQEHECNLINSIKPKALNIYKIIKGEWTCATFHAMLEYFYTERCHVSCEEVAPLWLAATQIMLKSLTDIIIIHPINEYLQLALKTEANRRHLLKLANVSCKHDLHPSK